MPNAECRMPNAVADTEASAARVVRVREGLRPTTPPRGDGPHGQADAPPDRAFSVILSRPLGDGEDMSIIATAADPKTCVAVPAAGSPHPDSPGHFARPPIIFAIGLKQHGGAMIKKATRLYNVRVKYVAANAAKPEMRTPCQ